MLRITSILRHLDPLYQSEKAERMMKMEQQIRGLKAEQITSLAKFIKEQLNAKLDMPINSQYAEILESNIEKMIANSFSTPLKFLENGLVLRISDLAPQNGDFLIQQCHDSIKSQLPKGFCFMIRINNENTSSLVLTCYSTDNDFKSFQLE